MRLPRLAASLLAVTFGIAIPAHAHDFIVSSTPSEQQHFPTAPALIELEFSAEIIPASPALLIQDAARNVVWEAVPELNGRIATAPFPALPDGAYRLNWSLVSADGHRLEGTIPFTLGTISDAPTPSPPSPPPGEASNGVSMGLLYGVGGLAAVGLLAVLLVRRRTAGE